MPEICMFFGIRVSIYYSDHNPPHFHVEYAEHKALVDIQEAVIIKGYLPNRQLKLVLAWCVLFQDELMEDWELARDDKELKSIPPLMKG